jgi:hypothetical protein
LSLTGESTEDSATSKDSRQKRKNKNSTAGRGAKSGVKGLWALTLKPSDKKLRLRAHKIFTFSLGKPLRSLLRQRVLFIPLEAQCAPADLINSVQKIMRLGCTVLF